MNIEEAKRLPMSKILKCLGHEPVYITENGCFYLSLFRAEETPGLQIKDNRWFDVITGEEGDSFDFVRRHLKHTHQDHTDFDIFQWMKFMFGYVNPLSAIPKRFADVSQNHKLEIRQTQAINNEGLVNYLESRGINLAVAKGILLQVNLFDNQTRKVFCALSLLNEKKGYELFNPQFKGHVGKRAYKLIRKSNGQLKGVHLFFDVFDYLTFLMMSDLQAQSKDYDVIILNAYQNLEAASNEIKGFGYETAVTWFYNDTEGNNCTRLFQNFCKLEEKLIAKTSNVIYTGHLSLNAWHMHNLSPKE